MRTKVLVVDDEPIIGELIQAVLASAGMEAESLADSNEAAARLQKEKFDAVFLDVHMPKPDGIELARQMRAAGFNQKTPIVMITGDDDSAVLRRGFEAGANFFLFKPLDRGRLLRVLRASRGLIQRERRRYQRVAVRCKVAIEADHQKLDATTLDLSLNGFLAQASAALPAATRVRVNLQLSPAEPPMQAKGRVVRVLENNCMGIQFQELGTAESERLQEFLLPLILKEMSADSTELAGV